MNVGRDDAGTAGGKNRKARIAVIGTGWWATYTHLPALVGRADVELVALANRGADKLRRAAEAFGVSNTYTDYREMLEREDLDGAVVATSHEVHYEAARAALERGCHVLLEKPMVLETGQARELLEIARSRNKEIVVSNPWSYALNVLRAREILQSGELGEVQLVSSLFTSFAYETYRGKGETLDKLFNGDAVEAPIVRPRDDANTDPGKGGGQGWCQVSHSAALVFWVTGLSARRVSAYMSRLDVAVDVVDAVSMRLSNGSICTLASTGNLKIGDPGQHTLCVYGSRGYLMLDLIAGTLLVIRNDGTTESPEPLPEDERYPRFAPANNFVDIILKGRRNLAPGLIGRLAVDVLDAAYRSAAAEGTPIDVEALPI